MSAALAIIEAGAAEAMRPWPRRVLDAASWRDLAAALADDPSLDLVALFADRARIQAIFRDGAGRVLPVAAALTEGGYAALSPARQEAAWFERAIRDLWGHAALGGVDSRPFLDHGHWPLAAPLSPRPGLGREADAPEFLPSENEDCHQIGLGPVQGGIVEPGHFRITALGETITRLEIRLGYTHKGILGLMRGKPARAAARFAARLAGDATVAHSIAYAHAVEAALSVTAPPRAQALRAVMAEIERIANHLGDLGGVAGDAACPVLEARFLLHREAMLEAAGTGFGHRLMMDAVIPGGVAADIPAAGFAAIRRSLAALAAELPALIRLYGHRSGLAGRLTGIGTVPAALARSLAACGVVGRAAGRDVDARRDPGYPPYGALGVRVMPRIAGDADARLRVRLDEIAESLRLIGTVLETLPAGALATPLPTESGAGIGVAESCRGDVWHSVQIEGGLVAAAFARDPSWKLWHLLEAAAPGGDVDDFPLCCRSFSLSCSAVDL